MDPNETLNQLREIAQWGHGLDEDNTRDNLREMADLFTNLDEWITKGGFLPDAWANSKSG